MRAVIALALLAALAACSQPAGDPEAVARLAARVQALEAERDVRAVLDAMDAGVDAKNWEQVRRQFADQVEVDFSSLGGAPGRTSADDLIAAWRGNLGAAKPSFHLRGGEIVAINEDTAIAAANGYAWNALPQRTENQLWETWGRYEFKLMRTEQGWKIAAMSYHAAYERGDSSIRTQAAP